jgi:NB-ARC domain
MNGDKTKASGPASVAIGGDADGAQVTTSNVDASGAGTVNITQNYTAPKDPSPQRLAEPINNLPEVAADFTGRVEEENTIAAALSREGGALTISALKGIGGIGKTALAVKIAHRLPALFPAAQLLVDLRGTRENPVSSRQAMESVIRRFHPEAKLPDDDAAIAEIYRDLLRHNKAILILDNAKDTVQAAPLLPPSPSAAMVTSRQALFLDGARSVRLDDLPLAEAKELLAKIFATERSCPEDERTELAQACLCHPLSLRVAALFLKHHQGRTIAAYVHRVGEDREQLKIEGVADHDVMAVLGQSLRQLEAEDAGLAGNWRDLSVFPADFDPAAAAAIWEIADIEAAIDRLASLETKGFLDAIAADRYQLHDLMRDLARRGRPEERTGAVALSHAQHFGQVLATPMIFIRRAATARWPASRFLIVNG